MPIISFSDADAQTFFIQGTMGKGVKWSTVSKIVRRKLDMMHFAAELGDLASPPGNRLEALAGDLRGWHSIRINDQWRIIFVWTQRGPERVRVTDYH